MLLSELHPGARYVTTRSGLLSREKLPLYVAVRDGVTVTATARVGQAAMVRWQDGAEEPVALRRLWPLAEVEAERFHLVAEKLAREEEQSARAEFVGRVEEIAARFGVELQAIGSLRRLSLNLDDLQTIIDAAARGA